MSESERYERSNSVVPLSHRERFLGRESVHLVWFSHFNRYICRLHRSVCHRCKFRQSISSAGYILDPFGEKWAIATYEEVQSPEEMQRRAAALIGQR